MSRWQASVKADVGGFELDVELEGDAGVMALIGPNGSGKTSLLRALAGAVASERAEIVVEGEVLASTPRGIDLAMEKRRVGYVPQGYALFPHLSVLDNVAFGLSNQKPKQDRSVRRRKALEMLEELGCAALSDRRVTRLSGGEQQRVALARALVIEPRLLLLDEPLAALDVSMRRAVRTFLVERLRAFARPSVLVTHDLRDIVPFGDDVRVCVLERGRIVQDGSLAELERAPASAFVAEFVGI